MKLTVLFLIIAFGHENSMNNLTVPVPARLNADFVDTVPIIFLSVPFSFDLITFLTV